MPRCKILGCTTGYDSNPEKGPFLTAPKDTGQLSQWKTATRLPLLKAGDPICKNHFLPSEVLTHKVINNPDGTILMKVPYKSIRRKEGAVPSQFSWTVCVSKSGSVNDDCSSSLKTSIPCASPVTRAISDCGYSSDCQSFSVPSPPGSDARSIWSPSTSTENTVGPTEIGVNNILRLKLKDLVQDIRLPAKWTMEHMSRDDRAILVLSKRTFAYVRNEYKIYTSKEIVVSEDLHMAISILEQKMNPSTFHVESTVQSVEMLQKVLSALDHARICMGSHTQENMPFIDCKTVKKDPGESWRHIACSLVITNGYICNFCRKAKNTVAKRIERLKKDETLNKRKIPISPKMRRQWLTMRMKVRSAERAKVRAEKKIELMKKEVEDCRLKLSQIKNQKLAEILEADHITHNQCVTLKQIIASAKCQKGNGQRYSEEWMILALLMHMKSPSTYRLLQTNEILPLPSIRTVRKYLSSINSSCGFDPKFFEILKKSFNNKSEHQKHGILLLDEMFTRESVTVNSTNLTYTGLQDFGEDGPSSSGFSDKANHGLVIMFQPIADKYTQPIAVFASRGPVKGDVLVSLIFKAIILMEGIGAQIHGVVTDGARTNRKFWSHENVQVSGKYENPKCNFPHPMDHRRKIFVFSDAPHLIKCIRNRLEAKGSMQMKPEAPDIKWEHIKILHEVDKAHAGPSHFI